jgi:hypothetical protein
MRNSWVFFFIAAVVALVVIHKSERDRLTDWLKDHCKWYRRRQGGRWVHWNGFWEREIVIAPRPVVGLGESRYFHARRQFVGYDMAGGGPVWKWNQTLTWNDAVIDDREDYTT